MTTTRVRPLHVSRWDLDKTYLRTEFDTMRDLVRTALERPDEKRTNPGAATLLRELSRSSVAIYILSGSPEQMRRSLEEKLALDGIMWDGFTLKPNLQNMLRLRFRALRDQLGYKLPALVTARVDAGDVLAGVGESLFGDDAEADAYVYSLYADIMAGRVDAGLVQTILERGRAYEDVIEATLGAIARVKPEPVVERIFIHLEQQTHPRDFLVYGPRVVPFYNYLQPAYVLYEGGRLSGAGLLRVAGEMVAQHRFDGEALARSYVDLARRGHLAGDRVEELAGLVAEGTAKATPEVAAEVRRMVARLPAEAERAREKRRPVSDTELPDYLALAEHHNRRRRKKG